MSGQLVSYQLDFDNCIILSNPRIVKNDEKHGIFYDKDPFFIGGNISSLSKSFTISRISGKRLFILTRLRDFSHILQSETTSYNIYKIPFHCLHKHKIKHVTLSKEDYILIASIGNESNKNTKPSLCIDDNLVNDIKQTMNVNVRGDGKNTLVHLENILALASFQSFQLIIICHLASLRLRKVSKRFI